MKQYPYNYVEGGCSGCPGKEGCGELEAPSSCDGCIHDLGGGCCRINAEKECGAGGGFELYKRKGDDDNVYR